MYSGNSVVDYLNQNGQKSDFATRAQLAASKGIAGYSGTAQQNTQLLNVLRGSQAVATTPQPQAQARPTATPSPTGVPQQSSAPAQSGNPSSAQDLINMGYYGYQGWNDLDAVNDFRATGGNGKGGAQGGGSGMPNFNAPTINLPELYKGLFENSGITGLEGELSDKSKRYTDAVANIKDNPYLAEATMTGRLAKLEDKFNNDSKGLKDDIAMKKADIETSLQLKTQQFNIESQQVQQAWSQFNSLLSAGALDHASGEDIANLTRSTGISSSMIRSAIDTSVKSKQKSQVIQVDDGTHIKAVVINPDTGEVINSTVLSNSKPAGEKKATESESNALIMNDLQKEISNGITLQDAIRTYTGFIDPNTIYSLYNAGSRYGASKETPEQLAQLGIKQINNKDPNAL